MSSYAPPTIDVSGYHAPTQPNTLQMFVQSVLGIYGQNYFLGNSSPLYELISLISLAIADANGALQLTYNNMSPATAIGAGQSLLVLLNGLRPIPATYSTCTVTLTGTSGATVINGVVQNAATGDLWDLPPSVTFSGSTVNVTATAQQTGPVNASANQLTAIVTPTAGWSSVTNGTNTPSLGTLVESASALRIRQSISTELPSITILDSTIANVAAVPGVTRYIVLENPTGSTDSFGNPAHSVSAVVEGGTNAAVAQAIYSKRGIGPLTNGSTGGTLVTVNVTSPSSGIVTAINFARPDETPIYVSLAVHLIPGGGTNAAVQAAIQAALASYLQSLSSTQADAGTVISFGDLVAAANTPNSVSNPYSIRAASFYFGTSSSPSTNTDFTLPFYEFAQGVAANIVVTFV